VKGAVASNQGRGNRLLPSLSLRPFRVDDAAALHIKRPLSSRCIQHHGHRVAHTAGEINDMGKINFLKRTLQTHGSAPPLSERSWRMVRFMTRRYARRGGTSTVRISGISCHVNIRETIRAPWTVRTLISSIWKSPT